MKTIDLKAIIDVKELNINSLAKDLFPGNKHPRLALNRVVSGETVLDANQISRLSHITGMDIDSLYTINGWKACAKTKKLGVIAFESGSYKAELDTTSWTTTIFHRDSIFHTAVLASGATPLSEYLEILDKVISDVEIQNKQFK